MIRNDDEIKIGLSIRATMMVAEVPSVSRLPRELFESIPLSFLSQHSVDWPLITPSAKSPSPCSKHLPFSPSS